MYLMPHIVLLGDSIFDNAGYTAAGPDLISQVRKLLPGGWHATLLAIDGATTDDIAAQLQRVPTDASRLVLSVGGNDALMNSNILHTPVESSSQVLGELADISRSFEKDYRVAVQGCRELRLPLTLCTIYNGCFVDPGLQRSISTALMVFNDVIIRVGVELGLTVIDLRFVCSSPADFANPIEPSSCGGAKMARVIVNTLSIPAQNNVARVVIS